MTAAVAPGRLPALPAERALGPLETGVLGLAVAAWGAAAAVEGHAGIVLAAVLGLGVGLLVCLSLGEEAPFAVRLFAWGYLARAVVAIAGYYQGASVGTAFWTGMNSDSERFFVNTLGSLEDALLNFEDPGFPAMNVAMAQLGRLFGAAHYLVNVQLIVVAGALYAPLAFAVAREVTDPTTARPVGWLSALHPTAVAFGSGLMRDAMVGLAGWGMVASAMRFSRLRNPLTLAICVLLVAGTWTMRSISAIIFLGSVLIWGVSYFVRQAPSPRARMQRILLVVGLGVAAFGLLAAAIVADPTVGARFLVAMVRADVLRAAGEANPEGVSSSGITGQLAGAGGALATLLLIPFWLVAPFPFYAWSPPIWLGGPPRIVDVLVGIGGLLNQLMFGLYLAGVAFFWRRRDLLAIGLSVGVVVVFLAINILTLGQIRYTMVHAYPYFFMAAAVGWRVLRRRPTGMAVQWACVVAVLGAMYVVYALLKAGADRSTIAGVALPLLAAGCAAPLLGRSRRARPRPPAPSADVR